MSEVNGVVTLSSGAFAAVQSMYLWAKKLDVHFGKASLNGAHQSFPFSCDEKQVADFQKRVENLFGVEEMTISQ